MNIYILQHVPFEKPGIFEKLNSQTIHMYENSYILPDEKDIDLLIVLGGPMSVHDNVDFLKDEKLLIKQMIDHNKPVLGVCLGAQLIAEVLGAAVYPNAKGREVGFGFVKKQVDAYHFLPKRLKVLHWHGDTFTLPNNATRLYSSLTCRNQAFIYNDKVIGLQFHMETTKETLTDIVKADEGYISGNILQNTKEDIINAQIPSENEEILLSMIDYIIGGDASGKQS